MSSFALASPYVSRPKGPSSAGSPKGTAQRALVHPIQSQTGRRCNWFSLRTHATSRGASRPVLCPWQQSSENRRAGQASELGFCALPARKPRTRIPNLRRRKHVIQRDSSKKICRYNSMLETFSNQFPARTAGFDCDMPGSNPDILVRSFRSARHNWPAGARSLALSESPVLRSRRPPHLDLHVRG